MSTRHWPADLRAAAIERRHRHLSPSIDGLVLFHDDPYVLTRGERQYVWDANGTRYLDGTAQNMCVSLGFGHPLTVQLVSEQVRTMAHCTTLFHHDLAGRYAEELIATMPAGDWVVHLVSSGSEAIDLAYSMARMHTGAFEILYLRNAYHGLHFSSSATTAFSIVRPPAVAPGFVQVPHPDQYKGSFGPEAGVEPYLAELERVLWSNTSGRVAGMIIEPIQGFGGVVPMPAGYMQAAFDRIRGAGGVTIVDEVQTGFGRLGSHFWGFQSHGVTPDIVVIGKGMGNGLPIAGVIARREVAESFARLLFFNTYSGNPVSVAGALSVVRSIPAEGLQARAAELGAHALERLRCLRSKHPAIGDVRGEGLLLGVEFSRDRVDREPDAPTAEHVQHALRAAGVIVVRGSGTRNVLRFNPPLCASREDVDLFVDTIDRALETPPPARSP
jgi:alanine-glyoxylate transaminase/(R)-3-amino-2-methylpropionate-pyruvate transaminase